MNRVALVALLCVAAQAVQAAPSDKVDCSKVDEVLDDLGGAQGMTFLDEKYPVSATAEEQVKRCAVMKEAVKTLRKYNKDCFTSLTQQVFSAVLRTRSQYLDKSCADNSTEFKEGLEAAKCANEQASEAVKEAERKTILSFQVLHEAAIPDEKLRVRRSCCAVQDGKKFLLDASKDKCAKHEKAFSEYVDSYTSEAMGLICPDAEKLDCGKLETIKIEGVALKSKFFLSPMIKLIKTLDH